MLTEDDTHASRLLRLVGALAAHAARYGQRAPELLLTPATVGWWVALYTGTALLAARILAFSEVDCAAVTVSTSHRALAYLAAPLDGLTMRLVDVRAVCDAAVAAGCAASLADIAVDPAELLTALDGLDSDTLAVVGRIEQHETRALSIADLSQRWRLVVVEHDPRHQLAARVGSTITAKVELAPEVTREVLYAMMEQDPAMIAPCELFSTEQLARVDTIRRALRDATVRVIL